MSKPSRRTVNPVYSEIVTDPAEIAAAEERDRKYRNTAAGQVATWMVIDAPLPLLAQFVVELAPDDRQEFLSELVARLPAEMLGPLATAIAARRDAPAPQG
jgi:hypothetical protein